MNLEWITRHLLWVTAYLSVLTAVPFGFPSLPSLMRIVTLFNFQNHWLSKNLENVIWRNISFSPLRTPSLHPRHRDLDLKSLIFFFLTVWSYDSVSSQLHALCNWSSGTFEQWGHVRLQNGSEIILRIRMWHSGHAWSFSDTLYWPGTSQGCLNKRMVQGYRQWDG